MPNFIQGILTAANDKYATWSTTNKSPTKVILSNGNLTATGTTFTGGSVISTIGKSSGKWYWEYTVNAATSSSNTFLGLATNFTDSGSYLGAYPGSFAYRQNNGALNYCFLLSGIAKCPCGIPCPGCSACNSTVVADLVAGDVISVLLDMNALTVAIYKKSASDVAPVLIGGGTTTLPAGTWYAAFGNSGNSASVTANFGGSTFLYYDILGAGYNQGIYN
jgi:hypothetical protein